MDFEADEPVEYISPQPAVSSVRSGNGGCLNSLGVAFVVLLAIVAALALLPQMLAQVGSAVRTAAGPPPYRYTTLAVPPQTSGTITIPISTDNAVLEGYFVINGGSDDVLFSVQTPAGTYLTNSEYVRGRHDYHYTGLSAGPYILAFGNPWLFTAGKTVVLYYRSYASR